MSIDFRTCRFFIIALLAQCTLFANISFSQSDVDSLLNDLKQGNAQQQTAAVRALTDIPVGQRRIAAIHGLVQLLDSPNANVRTRSAYALGYVGTGNIDVAKALIKVALDDDSQVRATAIKALVKIKAPQELTMPIWAKTLQGEDQESIMHVIQSMADLGADAIPALRGALKHPEAAYWALLVVSEIGPDAGALSPELLELIDHAQPEVQLQAIIAIGKIKGDSKLIVPALVNVLHSDAPLSAKYAACFALSGYPDQPAGVAALESTLDSTSDVELKLLAGWSLLTLKPDTSKRSDALTAIIAGLSSDEQRIRQLAVTALGDIKPGPKGPSVQVVQAMTKAMQDSDPAVISQVVDVMAAKGKAIIGVIKIGLSNDSLRPLSVELARRLGPDAAPLVPDLIKALKASRDPELTREIAFALAAIGSAASSSSEALVAELNNDSQRVRYSACYALGSIGANSESVASHLNQCLASDDAFLRLAAIWSLLKVQPGDAKVVSQAIPILTQALTNENEYVRMEAARTLGSLGAAAKASLNKLKSLSDDESSMVRQAAGDAVKAIESK